MANIRSLVNMLKFDSETFRSHFEAHMEVNGNENHILFFSLLGFFFFHQASLPDTLSLFER